MAKYHFIPDADSFKPVFTFERLKTLSLEILTREKGHIQLTENIVYEYGSDKRYYKVSLYIKGQNIILKHKTWINGKKYDDEHSGEIEVFDREYLARIYDKLLENKFI